MPLNFTLGFVFSVCVQEYVLPLMGGVGYWLVISTVYHLKNLENRENESTLLLFQSSSPALIFILPS